MKTIKIALPKETNSIEILPLADLHLGDVHCNLDYVQSFINYIKEHEYVYCVLNGDIINNAIKNSVSDIYGETMKPMEQLNRAYDLLSPIKEKILAITNGNHEFRTYREDGIDLMEILARQLGVADKYSKESALVFLKLGIDPKHKNQQLQYTLYLNHGAGGGKKIGGKANRLEDMAGIVDADIYIHSHTHAPMIFKQDFLRIDQRHSAVTQVEKLFVNTSATLDYGGYGEAFEFKPSTKQTPVIRISGVKKYASANL